MVAEIALAVSSVVRSAIAGKPTNLFSDWKRKAIGLTFRTRASACSTRRFRRETDGIGLFTAQIGWAWDVALLYVKGGAAVTSNRFDILDTPTGLGLVSTSATRWGGALGVGFEYGFAPNWSIGAEYDHLWMGDANNSFTAADPRLAGFINNRIRQDVDMFTLRLNYRFGGYAAPVTARY